MTTAVLICCILTTDATAQPAAFRAGAAVADITPAKLPVSMTGSFQDRQATGVHDRLHARCIVLADADTKLAIVVCDSCLLTRDILDAAKQSASRQTRIPVDHMLISATHTHTAATAVALAQCHPNLDYVKLLTKRIARSIVDAHARLATAKIGWGSGQVPEEIGNRRWFVKPEGIRPDPFGSVDDKVRMNPPRGSELLIRPAGSVDPEVALLSVHSATGRPLALLANYGLHYVGGIPPNQLSADYFGEFTRRIGHRLGGDESFVGIMSNGTSGDVNNYNFLKPRPRAAPFVRVRAVADRVAVVAHKALARTEHRSDVSLAVNEQLLELKVRRPDEAELKRARKILAAAADPQRLKTDEMYAQETIRLAAHAPTVTIKLQALRVGDVGIVTIPCEAFAEIGLEIKRNSPFKRTFVICLANGYNGYLPTPRQHALGGYETWRSGWSYLEVDASRKITDRLLQMLSELPKDGKR